MAIIHICRGWQSVRLLSHSNTNVSTKYINICAHLSAPSMAGRGTLGSRNRLTYAIALITKKLFQYPIIFRQSISRLHRLNQEQYTSFR